MTSCLSLFLIMIMMTQESSSEFSNASNSCCMKQEPTQATDNMDELVVEKEGYVSSNVSFYLKIVNWTYYLESNMSDRQWQHIGYNNGMQNVLFSCSRFFVAKAVQSNEIVVAFRGTSDLKDVSVNDRHVHFGVFQEGQKMLQKHQLLKELDSAMRSYPDSNLVFLGHSLGRGLASYLAWDISRQRPDLVISVYTFGSLPCTSNPGIGHSQKLSVVNFVNNPDPVPRASWERMSGAFRDESKRNRTDFRMPVYMFDKTVILQDDIGLGAFFDCFQEEDADCMSYHRILSYSKAFEKWCANDTSLDNRKESCQVMKAKPSFIEYMARKMCKAISSVPFLRPRQNLLQQYHQAVHRLKKKKRKNSKNDCFVNS